MKIPANKKSLKRPAQGFVLLLIVLTMLAIAGVVFLNGVGTSLSGSQRQVAQAQAANDVLLAAKAALLGYVLQGTDGGSGYRLGNLPIPDILNKAGTQIKYDGYGDGNGDVNASNKCLSNLPNGIPGVATSTSSLQPSQRCLGKFPWRDFSLDVGNPDTNDPTGQVPWLAISSNLNYWNKCLAILNSDTVNWAVSGVPSCPAAANKLPYPWMSVVDQYGKTVSNVAAVLIMPGPPIETGSRTQSRLATYPNVTDYLDAISLPLGCVSSCTGTYDNANLSNVFVQIPLGTKYPTNAENASLAGQPIKFNDVLVYITIDELMPYLERRVLSEMKSATINFYNTTGIGQYPWMAPFTSPTNISAFKSTANSTFGLFPFTVMPSVGTTAPSVSTDFDWSIPSAALTKNCVDTGGGLYVDTRQFLLSLYKTGSASGANPTCAWQVNGPSAVTCDYTNSTPLSSTQTFAQYTSASCSTLSGATSTYVIKPTSITVAIGATCNSLPTVTYAAASGSVSDFSRWNWQCSSVNSGTAFYIDVAYSLFTTGGAAIAGTSETARINAANKLAFVNKMRYQPLMPYWFYSNEWYLSAFAAVAPANAPSPVTPCGSVTKLTSGSTGNIAFLAILAGGRLPSQTRPSPSLADYLEEPNFSAGSSCAFSASGLTTNPVINDQVFVVSP